MLKINNDYNISLTRGDTGLFNISLVDTNGDEYIPQEGSTLRFAMSKKYYSEREDVLILKNIDIHTMELEIEPNDTKSLAPAIYKYDIELTDEMGRVSTVIMGNFTITAEVY